MRNRKEYPENWEDEIRPDILKRDKFRCTVCQVEHRKTYVFQKDGTKFKIPKEEIKEWKEYGDKAYTVYLQIAHLDQNRSNNNYENLRAMCPKCHLNHDRDHNTLKRKMNHRKNG